MRVSAVPRRAAALVRFLGFYAVEVLQANVLVAREVLTPRRTMAPAVVVVRCRVRTDAEVGTLAVLLALTPGTLPVAIDRVARTMTIHVFHSPSAEETAAEVAELERRLLEVFR